MRDKARKETQVELIIGKHHKKTGCRLGKNENLHRSNAFRLEAQSAVFYLIAQPMMGHQLEKREESHAAQMTLELSLEQ